MKYNSEKREKTSVSLRPSLWNALQKTALERGIKEWSVALEGAIEMWLGANLPEPAEIPNADLHRKIDALMASPEAAPARHMIDLLYDGMLRRKR